MRGGRAVAMGVDPGRVVVIGGLAGHGIVVRAFMVPERVSTPSQGEGCKGEEPENARPSGSGHAA
jgi:hypothetical protein